ncbi:hypothetical protein FBU59_002508 [Linderina macrospora]|uniref:Uncharacterized protein n=1 Tax=Linderina macrospora TaxID=4868 RepID=A0ACC1JAV8_9FUNG|nr:hypothetical protein FBU59_002508 [Linderina macrospora]
MSGRPDMNVRPEPVSLLDAPLILTSNFDPLNARAPMGSGNNFGTQDAQQKDTIVRSRFDDIEPSIMQRAMQLDAFSWQSLVIEEGLFQGEIMLGYNELQWLVQSFLGTGRDGRSDQRQDANTLRCLIEMRGRLFGWSERAVAGVAHLVEPEGISVISDIDDTIKASNIIESKRIVLETVFARPLLAVPGMAELYREWYKLGAEFHYVSNSPWQLYPSLDGFFHENQFPPGSAHLRTFDPNGLLSVSNFTGTPQMKRDTIEQLFSVFPRRKYIFVGDSGEHDLETYTDLARRFPDKVLRIYIRDLFAPLSVPSITTDLSTASNSTGGVLNYGVVEPLAPSNRVSAGGLQNKPLQQVSGARGSHANDDELSDTADLIQFGTTDSDAEYASDAPSVSSQKSRPPPVPPKPQHLRGTSPPSTFTHPPPPKPPRTRPFSDPPPLAMQANQIHASATAPHPPSLQQQMRNSQHMPGSWSAGANAVPGTAVDQPGAFNVDYLREQAQKWMAFYAQQFYVSQTKSFTKHAAQYLPTIEANPHIIQYDAIPSESDLNIAATQQQPSGNAPLSSQAGPVYGNMPQEAYHQQGDGSQQNLSGMTSRSSSFASFNIPEPPPTEAQLVRNSRRLQLWKRYVDATRGLHPDVCRLFVDAKDIKSDKTLFSVLFPAHSASQI